MLIETKFINYECLQMKCTSSHAPRTLVAPQASSQPRRVPSIFPVSDL